MAVVWVGRLVHGLLVTSSHANGDYFRVELERGTRREGGRENFIVAAVGWRLWPTQKQDCHKYPSTRTEWYCFGKCLLCGGGGAWKKRTNWEWRGLMGVLGGPVRIDGGRWVCSRVEMVEEEEEHRLSAQ